MVRIEPNSWGISVDEAYKDKRPLWNTKYGTGTTTIKYESFRPPINIPVFAFDKNVSENHLKDPNWHPPANVILDDACMWLAYWLVGPTPRTVYWPYNFGSNGLPRTERPRYGTAPIIRANKLDGTHLGDYFLVYDRRLVLNTKSSKVLATTWKNAKEQSLGDETSWTWGQQKCTDDLGNETKLLVITRYSGGTDESAPVTSLKIEAQEWSRRLKESNKWDKCVDEQLIEAMAEDAQGDTVTRQMDVPKTPAKSQQSSNVRQLQIRKRRSANPCSDISPSTKKQRIDQDTNDADDEPYHITAVKEEVTNNIVETGNTVALSRNVGTVAQDKTFSHQNPASMTTTHSAIYPTDIRPVHNARTAESVLKYLQGLKQPISGSVDLSELKDLRPIVSTLLSPLGQYMEDGRRHSQETSILEQELDELHKIYTAAVQDCHTATKKANTARRRMIEFKEKAKHQKTEDPFLLAAERTGESAERMRQGGQWSAAEAVLDRIVPMVQDYVPLFTTPRQALFDDVIPPEIRCDSILEAVKVEETSKGFGKSKALMGDSHNPVVLDEEPSML